MACRAWQLIPEDDPAKACAVTLTIVRVLVEVGVMTAMDVPAEGAADRPADKAVARRQAVNYISWVALALMTTSSVASLRPSPTMAVYGLACIFLYLVPAIIFLLPTSVGVGRVGFGL